MRSVSNQLFLEIERRARKLRGIVALPESFDERVLQAAHLLVTKGLAAKVFMFGNEKRLESAASKLGIPWHQVRDQWVCVDKETYVDLEEELVHFRKTQLAKKDRQESDADTRAIAALPLFQAGYLLQKGDVQAVVAGSIATTADVIRAALQTVGTAKGIKTVSGSFLMTRALDEHHAENFIFADCGVVIDPTVEQLVDIAESSVATFRHICMNIEPRVAFLSFSTKGSAAHAHAEKIARAAEMFRARRPEVASDGELQFDAAYVETVGKRKAPESPVAGRANVFIFPDLNAGNIAYKIAQRLGGFTAIGPLLQGTAKPYCDLSRGASVEDIVMAACINLIRSA